MENVLYSDICSIIQEYLNNYPFIPELNKLIHDAEYSRTYRCSSHYVDLITNDVPMESFFLPYYRYIRTVWDNFGRRKGHIIMYNLPPLYLSV